MPCRKRSLPIRRPRSGRAHESRTTFPGENGSAPPTVPERAEIRNRRRGGEVPRQSRVLRRRITLDTIDDCSQAETPSGQVISICGGMIRAPIRVSATSK